MAMLDRTIATSRPAGVLRVGLQGPPGEWPRDAGKAYWSLLRDLNAWCRDTGFSPTANPGVAEAAVREVWGDAC